jgi:hypothetical protein
MKNHSLVSLFQTIGRPLAGLGLAAVLAGGCDGSAADDASAAEPTDTVLASLDLGYGSLSFHEQKLEDGSTLIQVAENIPATYSETPFQRLVSEGHTSLEMWKSLMGDKAAPASLVNAHSIEAKALLRPTDEIIAGVFDKDGLIQKSAASCKSLADANVFKAVASDTCNTYAWNKKRYSVATSGSHYFQALDAAGNAATTSTVTMGICNDSTVNVTGRPMVKLGNSSSFTGVWSSAATVKPGQLWYWYNFSRTVNNDCSGVPAGQLCLTLPLPSEYRIDGSSPAGQNYYLYTGVLQATLKPACTPK